jgi:hypothetical protein
MPIAVWAVPCAVLTICATLGGPARAHAPAPERDSARTLLLALDADAQPADPEPAAPPPENARRKAKPSRKAARVGTKRTGAKVAQSPAGAAGTAPAASPPSAAPAPADPTTSAAPAAPGAPAKPQPPSATTAPAAPQAGAAAPVPQAPATTTGDFQPVLHARAAKITTCMDTIVGLSATVIDSAHTAISTWSSAAPNDNIFQSMIGLTYANNAAPNAAAVILAAPVGAGKCEGESVQVYPFAQSCTALQAALIKQGRTVATLRAMPVIQTNSGFEDILLPSAGGGCVVVSVGQRK